MCILIFPCVYFTTISSLIGAFHLNDMRYNNGANIFVKSFVEAKISSFILLFITRNSVVVNHFLKKTNQHPAFYN